MACLIQFVWLEFFISAKIQERPLCAEITGTTEISAESNFFFFFNSCCGYAEFRVVWSESFDFKMSSIDYLNRNSSLDVVVSHSGLIVAKIHCEDWLPPDWLPSLSF